MADGGFSQLSDIELPPSGSPPPSSRSAAGSPPSPQVSTSTPPSTEGSSSSSSSSTGYTLEEAIEKIGFGCFQIKLLFIVSAIWMADAMEMMLLTFLSPAVKCEWDLTQSEEATITTVVFVGMGVGSFFWGRVQDQYGRRRGYLACVVWTLVFGVATAFAGSYGTLLLCRLMVGFGVGGAHVAVTLFSEFLPSDKRAMCILLIEVFWAVGSSFEGGTVTRFHALDPAPDTDPDTDTDPHTHCCLIPPCCLSLPAM